MKWDIFALFKLPRNELFLLNSEIADICKPIKAVNRKFLRSFASKENNKL